MAFTVETGTGVANANSFVALPEAEQIADTLGVSAYLALADDTAKERALMQATRYLGLAFRPPAGTEELTTAQGLAWPRSNAYKPNGLAWDGVPQPVKEATVILAGLAQSMALFSTVAAGGAVQVKREKVGTLEVEYTNGSAAAAPYFGEIRQLMAMVGALPAPGSGGGIMQTRVER